MESAINAERNFYARRSVQPASPTPEQQRHQQPQRPYDYDSHPFPDFDSPQVPPKLPFLTTSNLQAIATNGYGTGLTDDGRDPDDFYRDYRAAQSLANGYTDSTAYGMAATTAESRLTPSSLRSNGNGTTPKHPPIPNPRNNLKPSYRSASAPLDNRLVNAKSTPALNGLAKTQQPSVKDLLKRFDQNNESSSSSARKPVPRLVTNTSEPSGYTRDRGGYSMRTAGNNSAATGSSKPGVSTREAGPSRVKSPASGRSTQRTRFAAEDQHSNNGLSSAARAGRTRNVVSGSAQASKSMTNLSPTSSQGPTSTPSRRPLFGEVLATSQPGTGYGIPPVSARRTSEASLHPPMTHQRSRSDVDVSPSSPTAWYLGVTPALDDVDPYKPHRSSPGHNRNHSDLADHRVNTFNGVSPSFVTSLASSASGNQASSRVPVATKRLSGSSSSSQPSTRASSPFKSRTVSNGKLRTPDKRPWSPAGRATTPTRHSARGRAKTPEKFPNNASLKAYISSPPPKTSPPLRSSRPRQPVSSATTTSAQQKNGQSTGSPPVVSGMKLTRNTGSQDIKSPRRIEDSGPVDFAARRERIQRAYTKSIHESEQREIRAANLRRLNERQARSAAEKAQKEEASAQETAAPHEPSLETSESSPGPLRVTTSFFKPRVVQDDSRFGQANQDSPTLGMPGSFVDHDTPPASAISNVTGTTEIDNEPQTEPPHASRLEPFDPSRLDFLSSNILDFNDFSPEQARYQIEQSQTPDGNGSIHIMLDATPVEDPRPEPTPTKHEYSRDDLRGYKPPGAYQLTPDLQDGDLPVFASTLTTASPRQTSPENSRPITPFDYNEQQTSGPDEQLSTSLNNHSVPHFQTVPGSQMLDLDEASHLRLPHMRSALSPLSTGNVDNDYLHTPVTDMEYDSSDGAGQISSSEQGNYDSCDQDRELQVSPRTYRASRLSAWTDYSVNSNNDSSDQEANLPGSASILLPIAGRKPSPPPKEQSPRVPPKPENYSPQPSPLSTKFAPRIPSPARDQALGPSDAFGLGLSDAPPRLSNLSTPMWPDYSPPPPPILHGCGDASPAHSTRTPPPLSFYNRRPQSSLYQPSLNSNSRNPESRRSSDDVYSPKGSESTPRSSGYISVEDVTTTKTAEEPTFATEEEKQVAEKKKKKLFQRRMLIKELVDTEAVYLKDMNVVEEIYKGTAEACPKLDGNDIKTIFRNSDQIVAFSTMFLDELKSATSSIYSPRSQRTRQSRATTATSSTAVSLTQSTDDRLSIAPTLAEESDEQKDMKTFVGANFGKHLKQMQTVYTDFLKNGELASSRLAALQNDGAVKVWLSECNLVAKDLTAAWDLDALLVKPVQRITRYQLLLRQIFEYTEKDHPDYTALEASLRDLLLLLSHIDDMKRRIHMVGKIVGRKRKESDTRFGIARAFGRRAEKLQYANPNRPEEDDVFVKLHEKFGDDYLRLQVVLRDVEFYTRQVTTHVNDFLRYLSSIELFMRTSASPYPELESKWVRFNLSMRDLGTVALEEHVAAVRKRVIEPFEQVIQAYGPPGLAMKKRNKRRLDYEKFVQGKKLDDKLKELVDQYEALNETLKLELPKLSQMTEKIGNICLIQFLTLQTQWYKIWQEKLKVVLEDSQLPKEIEDILGMFQRDYRFVQGRALELGIVNGSLLRDTATPNTWKSLSSGKEEGKVKTRPANLEPRARGMSLNTDRSPSLPTPDFAKRYSGQFTFSPIVATGPGLPQFAPSPQPYPSGHIRANCGSPAISESSGRQQPATYPRPNTGRSHASDIGVARTSNDFNPTNRRESGSTYSGAGYHVDGPLQSRPFSGLFHSAMPMPEGPEDSQRSSRASSRDRNISGGYNVLYLAASLFEFNISATKSEAGYPYLTYQAGEIFDVIGEKGELWLAKNQDDPTDRVGWIWSKHFARLATD